jgi:hypothetical protein
VQQFDGVADHALTHLAIELAEDPMGVVDDPKRWPLPENALQVPCDLRNCPGLDALDGRSVDLGNREQPGGSSSSIVCSSSVDHQACVAQATLSPNAHSPCWRRVPNSR